MSAASRVPRARDKAQAQGAGDLLRQHSLKSKLMACRLTTSKTKFFSGVTIYRRNARGFEQKVSSHHAFEIAAAIAFAHDSLLASNLGKKASTNLGAIQVT